MGAVGSTIRAQTASCYGATGSCTDCGSSEFVVQQTTTVTAAAMHAASFRRSKAEQGLQMVRSQKQQDHADFYGSRSGGGSYNSYFYQQMEVDGGAPARATNHRQKVFSSATGHTDGRVELFLRRDPQEAQVTLRSTSARQKNALLAATAIWQDTPAGGPQQIPAADHGPMSTSVEVAALSFIGPDSLVVARADGYCDLYDNLFEKVFEVGAEQYCLEQSATFFAHRPNSQGDGISAIVAATTESSCPDSPVVARYNYLENDCREDGKRGSTTAQNGERFMIVTGGGDGSLKAFCLAPSGEDDEDASGLSDIDLNEHGSTTTGGSDSEQRGLIFSSRGGVGTKFTSVGNYNSSIHPTTSVKSLFTTANAHTGPVSAVDLLLLSSSQRESAATAMTNNQNTDLSALVLSGGTDGVMRLFRYVATTSSSCDSDQGSSEGQLHPEPGARKRSAAAISTTISPPSTSVSLSSTCVDYARRLPLRAVTLDKSNQTRAASLAAKSLQLWDLHRMRAGFSTTGAEVSAAIDGLSSEAHFAGAVGSQALPAARRFFAKPVFFPRNISLLATGGQEFVTIYDVRAGPTPCLWFEVPGVAIMTVELAGPGAPATAQKSSPEVVEMTLLAQSYTDRQYSFDLRKNKEALISPSKISRLSASVCVAGGNTLASVLVILRRAAAADRRIGLGTASRGSGACSSTTA
ncbi:unnamed protein product, partial [Amoebophrya sp. A120]|eukprot:GSA120T00020301001.1